MQTSETTPHDLTVNYETFGAVGDGVHDDLPAICKAHAYANAHDLPVRSRTEATYHLGRTALTAEIATDTDWNYSRFIIDDREVDDHRAPLFRVCSRLAPLDLDIRELSRDQTQLDLRPAHDCHVRVRNDHRRRFIRRGLNQDIGTPQQDSFLLLRDGSIPTPIDWDYEEITSVVARPVDERPLRLSGGIFTTFANRMNQPVGYNYWGRNIQIERSNTEVVGLTHYVAGETDIGQPYRGFLSAENCAHIRLRDCFVSGHKIYSTIGSAGAPVNMGSYDLHANHVVDLHLVNCRMNHILDYTRWGVTGTNFCKGILLEDCHLSRMDTHMGVSGGYTLRRCELGHMGLNAIGRGTLLLEDSTMYGDVFLSLRGDYGSTWTGDVQIRNCQWTPRSGRTSVPHLISLNNDGQHDFGYPCSMPSRVEVDGLRVDDRPAPADAKELWVFADPDAGSDVSPQSERPFPYRLCEQITVRNLQTLSGRPLGICRNPDVQQHAVLTCTD